MIAGVILAGGRSRRMGGRDKSLLDLNGRALIAHAAARLAPQVAGLAISANGPPERFHDLQLPVLADGIGAGLGPLAGILGAMRWAGGDRQPATHIVTVAADTPYFPLDLVQRLQAAATGADDIVFACSGGRDHPVAALWPVSLAHELEADLKAGVNTERGISVGAWIGRRGGRRLEFAVPAAEPDPFFNINTPDDLEAARRIALATAERG